VLQDGKASPAASCIAGAVRIRALLPEARLMVQSASDRDVLYPLEITAEPTLDLLRVLPPRISRAEDEGGLALRFVPPTDDVPTSPYEEMLMVDDMSMPAGNAATSARLRLRDSKTKKIAEMHGSVLIELRTPPMPLATIDNVFQTKEKNFPSADGGSVTINEVKREGDRVTMKVTQRFTPGVQGRNAAVMVRIQGGAATETVAEDSTGLALYDSSGKRVPATTAEADALAMALRVPTPTRECTLVYTLPKSQEPARLVYTGRRNAVIDVPFTLKELPVPGLSSERPRGANPDVPAILERSK
jgi:hypothetical protein